VDALFPRQTPGHVSHYHIPPQFVSIGGRRSGMWFTFPLLPPNLLDLSYPAFLWRDEQSPQKKHLPGLSRTPRIFVREASSRFSLPWRPLSPKSDFFSSSRTCMWRNSKLLRILPQVALWLPMKTFPKYFFLSRKSSTFHPSSELP